MLAYAPIPSNMELISVTLLTFQPPKSPRLVMKFPPAKSLRIFVTDDTSQFDKSPMFSRIRL